MPILFCYNEKSSLKGNSVEIHQQNIKIAITPAKVLKNVMNTVAGWHKNLPLQFIGYLYN